MIQVVYITGFGRSGSTVLNITLGQHEDVIATGELGNLSRRVWHNDEYCSCGERVRACAFWSAVVGAMAERGDAPLERLRALQSRHESLAFMAATVQGWPVRARLFQEFRELTLQSLEAIRSVSGRSIVVDSSKLPTRAFALSLIPEIDLRVIHLVRDGRGVAWSLRKPYAKDERAGFERALAPRPVLRTALRWATMNLAAERVCRRLGDGRWLRVRYEDFVADPRGALRAIGETISVDLTEVGERLVAGAPFEPGHQVAGNQLRMSRTIRLQFDQEWTTKMPGRQKALFQSVCGPLQRRYGYA
jgi:Sulfotransferase family